MNQHEKWPRKNPDTKVSNTPSVKKERKILLCQPKYIHIAGMCPRHVAVGTVRLACNFKQKKSHPIHYNYQPLMYTVLYWHLLVNPV